MINGIPGGEPRVYLTRDSHETNNISLKLLEKKPFPFPERGTVVAETVRP